MKTHLFFLTSLFGATHAFAAAPMTLEAFVQRALASSPAVRAAESQATAAAQTRLGRTRPANPTVELAPGAGFTNGNLALSQELDLFGRRASQAAVSKSQLKLEQARLLGTRLEVAGSALKDLAEWTSALESNAHSQEAIELATALLDVTRARYEAGEVPQVHVSRAELELLRIRQKAAKSDASLLEARTRVDAWLGPGDEAVLPAWSSASLLADAVEPRSTELLVAEAEIQAAEAEEGAARAASRPHVQAGIAFDAWSLDRSRSLGSSNIGFQLFLAAPMFDWGATRHSISAAQASRQASQERFKEAHRQAQLRFQIAQHVLQTAQQVALAYEGDILPRGEAMVRAMRDGYAAGLVTLVEVIEAQQALIELREEQLAATATLRLAELEVLITTAQIPGWEVSP